MMSIFFSATTLWFYDSADKSKYESGIGWPTDAVEISDEDWKKYIQSPADGYVLGSENGSPAWVSAPSPSTETLVAEADLKKTQLRTSADSEIAWRQDAVDLGEATDAESSSLTEWKKYRVLLMRIDTSTAPDITWPTLPGQSS